MLITNPPYGQRIGEQKELDSIYQDLKTFADLNPTWSVFLITADKTFESKFGRPADRRRKLYNGRILENSITYNDNAFKREAP